MMTREKLQQTFLLMNTIRLEISVKEYYDYKLVFCHWICFDVIGLMCCVQSSVIRHICCDMCYVYV